MQPCRLSVDATDVTVGSVLEQRVDGHWKTLAVFSRKLSKPETKYSVLDHELLAMHVSVHRTSAYHSQANGLVEHFHKHLKSSLMAQLTGANWVDVLTLC